MNEYYNDFENEQVQEYYELPQVPKEKRKKAKKNKDPFIGLTFRQLIVCGLALIAVVVFGNWDSDVSRNVRDKYIELFCQKTSVNEVIGAFSQSDGNIDVSPTDIATSTNTESLGNAILVSNTSQTVPPVSLVKTDVSSPVVNSVDMPINGRITSEFGYRDHPIYGEELFHKGIDIGGDYGDKIKVVLSGEVVEAQYDSGYGYYMKIRHSDNTYTLYAHCQKLLKKVGQKVTKGEVIAEVGSTGVSTGPHCHFEIIINGTYINPRWVLNIDE